MIRPVTFFVLLSICAATSAQPLYKWVEKDGSITFSVKPPPSGVSFETVNSDNLSTEKAAQNTIQKLKPRATSAPKVLSSTALAPLVPPTQALRATPSSTGVISRENPSDQQSPSSAMKITQLDQSSVATLNARNRKEQQCDDLRKRVVSLERRLQTRLTPDDMDNTVVHMARYQRSFDQHCVQ